MDRACVALGNLKDTDVGEVVQRVVSEFNEAHRSLFLPITKFVDPGATIKSEPTKTLQKELLRWLVMMESDFPVRDPVRHAGENGLGVGASYCLDLWKRTMPIRLAAAYERYHKHVKEQEGV